ncbi:TEA domain-containing protein [Mycena indigotica]|uniref:TEA domain-containing protein n=1 Tax=Mycena indigotica TaxID=2126181 RepID=A0A8H6S8V1_9AGAR|nr:TEA domain-containing protein [Mycena indigotica]KAF7294964.1 TEA domain-containing protein [Mycena indigotica]
MSFSPSVLPKNTKRKHHKLLKDGSGTAVWPENVEQIFVQGLREYWESPWASYSGRGRSRWRNQFLVDYLASQGIQRSKKQVASHIQVLRNMWKGEPQYNLVAGADELFQDPVKLEDQPTLLTIDDDDISSASNSPPDQLSEFPPSPAPGLSYSPTSPLSSIPDIVDSPPHSLANLVAPYPYVAHQKSFSPHQPPNRTTSFTLVAEGMTPFIVNLDKLSLPATLPARTPPLSLRLRLSLPRTDDPHAPTSLHGFFASVRLAAIWSGHAKVLTHVYDPAGRCAVTDAATLHASSIDLGTVVAEFPESALTRSRWCDPLTHSTITQQLLVDNSTLLFVVYELDRHSGHSMPSVEFLSFQKYVSNSDASTTAMAQPTPSMFYYPQYTPSTTSSLSAALTPIS